jgi:hypothetical protein
MGLPGFIVIARDIRIARAQRYPANGSLVLRNKCHQRRRILRPGIDCFRNPVPLASHVGPTAIVIWSVSPLLRRDPGRSVWIIVGPLTLLVGRPPRSHAWSPAVAITAHVLPVAVSIKIVYPRNRVTHVLVTHVALVRIIVGRIIQITIVVAIAAVVGVGILVAIIVIDLSTRTPPI